MNYDRLFVVLYCSAVFAVFSYHFRDQWRYMTLTRGIFPQALFLGKWPVPRLSSRIFGAVGLAFLLCLGLATFGIMPRLFLLTCCVLYFLYFGNIRSLSYVVRKSNLVPQLLFVMALAPGVSRPLTEPCPTWPLSIVKILIIQVYFSAAYSKLRATGLQWATPSQLQSILMLQNMKFDIPLAAKAAQNGLSCSAIGVLTLVHQVTFPIVLLFPRLEPYYVIAALLFHLGTKLLMRIDYLTYQGPAYISFAIIPLGHYLMTFSSR